MAIREKIKALLPLLGSRVIHPGSKIITQLSFSMRENLVSDTKREEIIISVKVLPHIRKCTADLSEGEGKCVTD